MNFFDEIGKSFNEAANAVGKATNLDPDAIKSAATGGVAGAGLSSLVGGMGLAVGGTAVGIGLLPVAAVGAIVGLSAYGISKAVNTEQDNQSGHQGSTQEDKKDF